MLNYIILDIGKIIISWENKERKFYKETNNQLTPLSKEEENYLNNYFNKQYSYELNSEYLTNLINNNINIKEKEQITVLLSWLEILVPDNAKNNFYKNIQTLKINYDKENISNNKSIANYDDTTNEINIFIKNIQEIAIKSKIPDDELAKLINQTTLHELCHVASSKYNEDTKIAVSGFNTYPTNLESEKNLGLTEGMTEIISMFGIPNTLESNSTYYIEASIINQLISIIGNKELINSYFMNNGTSKLEAELNNYNQDPNISWNLFRNIETNFLLRNDNIKQTFLSTIQNTLIDYLNIKLKREDISNDEKDQSILLFKQFIITPEKLKLLNKDPNNYVDLQTTINKFNTVISQHELNSKTVNR